MSRGAQKRAPQNLKVSCAQTWNAGIIMMANTFNLKREKKGQVVMENTN
jgi:hypothetical protein